MIKSLQFGRAIAAIGVVLFHLSIMMGETRYGGNEVFRNFTRDGNRGVDFFFILSGFIIMFAHAKDVGCSKSVWQYLYRRFVRLYPIYWAYTSVACLMVFAFGGAGMKIPSTFLGWLTSLTLIRFSNASPPFRGGLDIVS